MVLLLLVSMVFASIESLVPPSVLLGWSSAVGVMRRDWRGVMTVIVVGILRDVVLVSRLGVSSFVFVIVWLMGAFASSKFECPIIVVGVVSVIASISWAFLADGGVTMIGVIITLMVSVFSTAVWGVLRERRSGIRLREL